MNGKLIMEASKAFDNMVKENTSLLIYIKVGYQEPTIFVKAEKVFEDVYPFALFNAGNCSISSIIVMLKDFQQIAKENGFSVSFAADSEFSLYLKEDKDIENVISITKDAEEIFLKFIKDNIEQPE